MQSSILPRHSFAYPYHILPLAYYLSPYSYHAYLYAIAPLHQYAQKWLFYAVSVGSIGATL